MKYFLLIFLALDLSAQRAKVETLQSKNAITGEVYKFPKVIVDGGKTATLKINNLLRKEILLAPNNTADERIFDNVWMKKGMSTPVVSNISFETLDLNDQVVSLAISAEGCGAYCEGFTRHFMFNVRTGNQLKLDSIFTKEGVDYVLKKVNNNKTITINDKLKEIEDTLKQSKRDIVESYTAMKEMYMQCLEMKSDRSYVSNIQFTIKKGVLTVITERCSSHANMAMDELWEFKTQLNLKDNAKLLTKFGMKLID